MPIFDAHLASCFLPNFIVVIFDDNLIELVWVALLSKLSNAIRDAHV